MTSSDILDTALSIQIRESLLIIVGDMKSLLSALMEQVSKSKDLLSIGRSHGMFAEPMIFGQKFLSFHQEFSRRLKDYELIIENEITGQLSGAVGNYTILDIEIESLTLSELGLKTEPVSTQVIPRDHLAIFKSLMHFRDIRMVKKSEFHGHPFESRCKESTI